MSIEPHKIITLQAKLESAQKELAETIIQLDLTTKLLRRQTLVNAQLQRQIMISWRLSAANLLWKNYNSVYHRVRQRAPAPLKQFLKRHLLGIR